jgi:ectoine hydroxylase-related dioxygenase (phytanoyl-CoA dioxygenase family)
MTLDAAALARYRETGHVTVPGVFAPAEMQAIIAEIERWGEAFLADLPAEQRRWYVDGGVKARDVLRKLDNPHIHCAAVRRLAADPRLVALVESATGPEISIYFSQIFFKPPGGGGPKPAHQDNFYFGPNDRDGMITAWVALDDATVENGCMFFAEGSNRGPVFDHVAPEGEPFNLQLTDMALAGLRMTPAPVPRGGVSFHHGSTVHQSGPNLSARWRRACALHYGGKNTFFATPALPYDHGLVVRIS